MNVIANIFQKDLIAKVDTIILGQVIGDVMVESSAELFIKGLVLGDLTLELGSKCTIHGSVIGDINNLGGSLVVFGLVNGEIITEAGITRIDLSAKVLDKNNSNKLKSPRDDFSKYQPKDNVLNFC